MFLFHVQQNLSLFFGKNVTPQNGLLMILWKETHSETKSWKSSRISTKKVTTTTGFMFVLFFHCFIYFIILFFFNFFLSFFFNFSFLFDLFFFFLFWPGRDVYSFEASFPFFLPFSCFPFLFSFIFFHFPFSVLLEKMCFVFFPLFFKYMPLPAFVLGFYKRCFLRSRCSMEVWCPDDTGRDSWDWVGPPAQERA